MIHLKMVLNRKGYDQSIGCSARKKGKSQNNVKIK